MQQHLACEDVPHWKWFGDQLLCDDPVNCIRTAASTCGYMWLHFIPGMHGHSAIQLCSDSVVKVLCTG